VPQAIARMREVAAIDLQGLHAHIGSQILTLEQFEAEVAALAELERFGVYDVGGGLGVRYVPEDAAPGVGRLRRAGWWRLCTATSEATST
jgi:diaminopimelate decarboxylase